MANSGVAWHLNQMGPDLFIAEIPTRSKKPNLFGVAWHLNELEPGKFIVELPTISFARNLF